MKDDLKTYKAKRDFNRTREPAGACVARFCKLGDLHFVVQKHDASHLHYDFRLEMEGVLRSWAVPKGPSLNPGEKRLAMLTEDHPIDYGGFEGVIPKGNYGAGNVILWDNGTYEMVDPETPEKGWKKGKLHFVLPTAIGATSIVDDVKESELRTALKKVGFGK